MKRRAVHFVASVAELVRFLAIVFLASGLGAFGQGGQTIAMFRYASASQLLFTAAFFFIWLDPARYRDFGKLVILGKIICLAAYFPLGSGLLSTIRPLPDPSLELGRLIIPGSIVIAVDFASLFAVLGLVIPSHADSATDRKGESSLGTGAGALPPAIQGPDQIEKVEG